jgi:hypothetical protein
MDIAISIVAMYTTDNKDCFHIIPPKALAFVVHNPETLRIWDDYVSNVLSRFGSAFRISPNLDRT